MVRGVWVRVLRGRVLQPRGGVVPRALAQEGHGQRQLLWGGGRRWSGRALPGANEPLLVATAAAVVLDTATFCTARSPPPISYHTFLLLQLLPLRGGKGGA